LLRLAFARPVFGPMASSHPSNPNQAHLESRLERPSQSCMAQALSAVIAGVVALVVSFLGSRWEGRRQAARLRHAFELQERQIRHEIEKQREQLENDLKVQEARLREELRTEYRAEDAIVELLRTAEPLRRFDRIKERIGGFNDEELRRLLVRAGALKYRGHDGSEMWALRDRYSH
jgi:hypothetical protein